MVAGSGTLLPKIEFKHRRKFTLQQPPQQRIVYIRTCTSARLAGRRPTVGPNVAKKSATAIASMSAATASAPATAGWPAGGPARIASAFEISSCSSALRDEPRCARAVQKQRW